MKKYIYQKIDWVGKKLLFSEKRKEVDKIKQRYITAQNYQELKFSLLYKAIDVYIKTYFHKRKLYLARYITGMGKCYIKMKYFAAINHIESQNINKFIKFEVLPQNKRNKLFKFLISDCDFQLYFKLNIEFHNAREFLIFMNQNILKRLALFKTNLYSKLKIPLHEPNEKDVYFLENMFRPLECELKKPKQFLEKKCNIYIIIVQVICKIEKYFLIATVKKNKILNNIHISVYFQKSSRRFSCLFSRESLIKFEPMFLDLMFPYDFDSLKDENRLKFPNYFEFRDFLANNQSGSSRNNSKQFLSEIFDFNEKKAQVTYLQQFIWEKLVKEGHIVYTAKNKLVFKINRYCGVLREELLELNIHSTNENILLEITFNNPKKVKSPFKHYKKIDFLKLKKYKVFIKTFNLQKISSHCQAFSFRELFYSKMKLDNDDNINKISNFSTKQSEMKSLVFYWANLFDKIIKIKEKNGISFLEYDQNFFEGDEKLLKSKINVNRKFKFQEIVDKNENFLIFKTILTIKPRQSVSLLYNPMKKQFIVLIFIHSTCLKIKKFIEFEECGRIVQNLEFLIKIGNFKEIGQRFFKKLKNVFIIKSIMLFFKKSK